jgi:hypothetical protein
MRRLLLRLTVVLLALPTSYGAISSEGSADLGNNSAGSSSLTASYTVSSNANRILWVTVKADNVSDVPT